MEDVSESTRRIGDRITRDAKEKADKILEEAREKAREVIDAALRMAEEVGSSEDQSLRERYDETARRRSAELEVEEQRRLTSFRSEIIEEMFKKVQDRLEEYVESEEYAKTLKSLIIEAASTLGGGELVVLVNNKDRRLVTRRILEEFSREVQELTGNETGIQLSKQTGKQLGGAVVSTTDGTANIDNTLEARIERVNEDNLLEIETILFG